MDAPDGLPSDDLPFAVDNHSLNRWRAQSQSRFEDQPRGLTTTRNASPQHFEDFIAAEIARDKERGIAGSPIAPSIVSDVPTAQKRLLRRHRKLLWACLLAFQSAFGSTVAAVVFVAQDAKGFGLQAGHLIWALLSLTATVGSAALLSTLYIRRRDRRKKETSWAKLEIEKYKRDIQKSQKEVDRMSAIGHRLEKEYRSATKAGSLRSHSAHSERRSKHVEQTDLGKAGRTFLDYREIYKNPGLEMDTIGFGKSVNNQPSQPRQDLLPQDDGETLQMDLDRPAPHVPPKDIASPQRTASNSEPTYEDSADYKTTSLGRYVLDEIKPRRAEGLGAESTSTGEDSHVVRAGHGDGGSLQSDENFREMHQLDSDAISDDSRFAELRRGRSRERVEPWQQLQTTQQEFENPHTPVKAPRLMRADDGRHPNTMEEARKGFRRWTKRRGRSARRIKMDAARSEVQHEPQGAWPMSTHSFLGVTYRRPMSLQRRSMPSMSAPVQTDKATTERKESVG
ncbi:MAG: hypothetical protein M1830_005538 [Pleopsidium flavum]|nr:MAG: hypothetical protein M1830_005538 [Pleopsidium flavum]